MMICKDLQDGARFRCWIRFADDMFSASRARGTAGTERELIQIACRVGVDSALARCFSSRAKGMVVKRRHHRMFTRACFIAAGQWTHRCSAGMHASSASFSARA